MFLFLFLANQLAMKRSEESVLAVLYKVLDDIAWQLEVEHLDYLFDRLHKIPLNEFLLKTVDLVKEMSRFTYKAGMAAAVKSIDLMWRIFQDESAHLVSAELAVYARTKLEETLAMFSLREQRLPILQRCLEALLAGRAVPHVLHVMTKILESFTVGGTVADPTQRAAVIDTLATQHDLAALLLRDLEAFKTAAQQQAQAAGLAPEAIDAHVFGSHTPYLEAVRERLVFLRYILQNSQLPRLAPEQVDVLWARLYQQALTSREQDECVRWLRQAAGAVTLSGAVGSAKEPTLLQPAALAHLFHQRLVVDLMPQFLTLSGYECAVRYFLIVNAGLGSSDATALALPRLQLLPTALSDTCDQFVVHDFDLAGMDYMWRVALEAVHPKVVSQAIEFLNRLHERLADHLRSRTADIRSAFIAKCAQHLQTALDASSSTSSASSSSSSDQSANRTGVLRCLALLTNLLDASEQRGYSGLRSHGTQLRGPALTLNVEHALPKNQHPKKFTINAHANDAVCVRLFLVFSWAFAKA